MSALLFAPHALVPLVERGLSAKSTVVVSLFPWSSVVFVVNTPGLVYLKVRTSVIGESSKPMVLLVNLAPLMTSKNPLKVRDNVSTDACFPLRSVLTSVALWLSGKGPDGYVTVVSVVVTPPSTVSTVLVSRPAVYVSVCVRVVIPPVFSVVLVTRQSA